MDGFDDDSDDVNLQPVGEAAGTLSAVTNPAYGYLATVAPTGRRTMRSTLRRVAAMLGGDLDTVPWAQLRYQHVQALRTRLAETLAPATVNKYLAAIRGVVREAWRLGLMGAETYQRITAVRGVKGATVPAGRGLCPDELAGLMRVCVEDQSPAGARDAAIIALGYGAGLRRAELAGLDLADLDELDNEGGDHRSPAIALLVRGKGSKQRMTYMDNGAADALRDYLDVRGDQAGPLFYSGRRGGHLIAGQRMSGQAIRDMLVKRAAEAGIEKATPHDLRRSFVSDLLDAGVDIATAADMAGHAKVETTRRYDRRGDRAKQRAARALRLP